MKILHLLSQHPESTGSGFYLQNIIRQAAGDGHQNGLIAGVSPGLHPNIAGIEPEDCYFVRFGAGKLDFPIPGMSDVMPYPSSRFSSLTPSQLDHYSEAFTQTIRQAVSEFSPDIIHSHHLWLATAAARSAAPDIPLVTSCHSTDLRQFELCPHLRRQVLESCLKIDRVLALHRDQAKKIRETFHIDGGRIDIVGGGYDEKLFYPAPKSALPPIELLYAGKLSLAKGVDWLLRTLIRSARLDFHLHLAGSGTGEEEQTCLALAEKLGRRATIHGRVDQKELARLMKHCHVFILPSFYEGLPLVLLEALGCGCRIITTDLSGCRELLAGAPIELVRFINLPKMQSIDRPDPRDWPELEFRLAEAISHMADHIHTTPSPDTGEITRIVADYGWQAVFGKIAAAYGKAQATAVI